MNSTYIAKLDTKTGEQLLRIPVRTDLWPAKELICVLLDPGQEGGGEEDHLCKKSHVDTTGGHLDTDHCHWSHNWRTLSDSDRVSIIEITVTGAGVTTGAWRILSDLDRVSIIEITVPGLESQLEDT